MTLATQCPHCQTVFRVAHDQLKLRGGLVRCGRCKQIFNGSTHLVRSDQSQYSRESAKTAADTTEPGAAPATGRSAMHAEQCEEPLSSSALNPQPVPVAHPTALQPVELHPEAADVPASGENSASIPMTLIDFGQNETKPDEGLLLKPSSVGAEPAEPDPIEQALDELERKPLRNAEDRNKTRHPGEPSFMLKAQRQLRRGPALRIMMMCSCALLFISLVAQSTYLFRDQLAARYPDVKPVLAELCDRFGCVINLPAQAQMIAIESSELRAIAPAKSGFALTALISNRSSLVQQWPHLELTLSDSQSRPVARRVLAPADYVPLEQQRNSGLPPRSEQPIKVLFEISQLEATDYRVYPFYP